MEKNQILSFIKEQLVSGKISKRDIEDLTYLHIDTTANNHTSGNQNVEKQEPSKNLIGTFYAIGATIAVVGISILIGQHWNEIGFVGRISVTLGISFVTFATAILLKNAEYRILSQILFTFSAALAPLGSYILLNQANIGFGLTNQFITACVIFIVFSTAYIVSNKNILILIMLGFATWAYYAVILNIFGSSTYSDYPLRWATMILGLSYICISYGHSSTAKNIDRTDAKEKKSVQNVLYSLGTLAVLGVGISTGGVFDLLLIALIFGAFYGSVYLKSQPMLILAALFLVAHIFKLTSNYFVGSIGWPVALIIMGFMVICIGYCTYILNKKFISQT